MPVIRLEGKESETSLTIIDLAVGEPLISMRKGTDFVELLTMRVSLPDLCRFLTEALAALPPETPGCS